MFETCINNIYDIIDDILIFLGIRKEEKSNFFDELSIYNYKIILNDS